MLVARPAAAQQSRFWAVLRDDTQLSGDRMEGDVNSAGRSPKLGGRPLFEPANPVRLLHDTTLESRLAGPYVEFADGDVLPGQLVRAGSRQSGDPVPPHLVVVPDGGIPLPHRESTELRVRQAAVKRVVFTHAVASRYQPGRIVYRDGRQITARSIRWSGEAIRALGPSGVVSAAFDELAEVHVPQCDVISALLRDATWPGVQEDDLIVMLKTANGGRFTYPRSMIQTGFRDELERQARSLGIQPAWALDAVRLADESVVFRTYRRPEEVPLSLLPVSSVQQRKALHAWPWRRNRNVLGGALRVGTLTADLGVGAHAHSEITFDLPPGARRFTAWVGLDNSVADGGCVRCSVYRDQVSGQPSFASGFLIGSDKPTRVGPLDIPDARRLVLVSAFAHQGRPPHADPLDIRDHVDWLMPWVTLDAAALERRAIELGDWIPPLTDWTADGDAAQRMALRPWWNPQEGRWRMAMVPDAEKTIADASSLELTRRIRITLANAYLRIAAGRDRTDSTHHIIGLKVDGKPHATTLNGELRTSAGPGQQHDRVWILADYVGREVTLSLELVPQGDGGAKPAGILWGSVQLGPLIEDLPDDDRPIEPDVPLTSLEPVEVSGPGGKQNAIQAGKLWDGSALNVRGYEFATGFGVPAGTTITYKLDPSYRRFVAVVGLADGWQAVGPYQILLDGTLHWSSTEPATFGRNTPGRQIDVPIPPGHSQIQLRLQGPDSSGAWAAAGFMAQ